jgi:SAM-dependent methyltransferase
MSADLPSPESSAGARGYTLPLEFERRVETETSSGLVGVGGVLPSVLDACCGSRMFWFDKADPRALFVDKRRETHPIDIGTPGTVGRSPIVVNPDVLADFTNLPFSNESFALVVFDPPHVARRQGSGIIEKKYGWLDGDWRDMLRGGFAECFRVLKPQGTLIFKWAETDIPLADVLALTPERPLFGHRSGKKLGTHWCAFFKGGGGAEPVGTRAAMEPKGYNDPKLSDRRSGRGTCRWVEPSEARPPAAGCPAGVSAAKQRRRWCAAGAVTAEPVRCSVWFGDVLMRGTRREYPLTSRERSLRRECLIEWIGGPKAQCVRSRVRRYTNVVAARMCQRRRT